MRVQEFFLKIRSWISILLLLFTFCCFFLFNTGIVLAHRPHDVIEALEVSPTYKQDQTLFVIVRQNLLKSSDGGQSWQRITDGLDNRYILKSLSISPQSSQNVYLSSLGDGIYYSFNQGKSWQKINGNLNNLEIDLVSVAADNLVFAAGYDRGLYRTTNQGQIWTQVIANTSKITAIASLMTKDNSLIVASDSQGIFYLSNDKGTNWKQIKGSLPKPLIQTIAISPNFITDQTFLVGTRDGGIFKTVDGGASFSSINKGLIDKNIMSVKFSPNYQIDSKLFASSEGNGFFVSENGGNSWTSFHRGLTKEAQAKAKKCLKPRICPSPHFSDLKVANFTEEEQTLFLAGFDGLFISKNGGKNWNQIETLSVRIIVGLDISPDYVNDSTVMFATYAGGAVLSENGGKNWIGINIGLNTYGRYRNSKDQINRLFSIIFSKNYSSDKKLFSSTWGHIFISENRGRKWQIQKRLPYKQRDYRHIFLIVISPDFASDNTFYTANLQGIILKSTNGGVSFSQVGQLDKSIYSLVISPSYTTDRTLYASTPTGIYKTIDSGQTWGLVSQTISFPEQTDFSLINKIQLAISPNYATDRTVFAGTSYGLFMTQDGGENWRKLPGEAYGKDGYIAALAISPDYQHDRTLIMTVKGIGLFKTVDGGKSFTQIRDQIINDNNLLLNMTTFFSKSSPIKFSPTYARDKTIYGYSEKKLFKSIDGGETWQHLPLPESPHKSFLSYLYYRLNDPHLLNTPKRKFVVLIGASLLSYLLFRYMKQKIWLSH